LSALIPNRDPWPIRPPGTPAALVRFPPTARGRLPGPGGLWATGLRLPACRGKGPAQASLIGTRPGTGGAAPRVGPRRSSDRCRRPRHARPGHHSGRPGTRACLGCSRGPGRHRSRERDMGVVVLHVRLARPVDRAQPPTRVWAHLSSRRWSRGSECRMSRDVRACVRDLTPHHALGPSHGRRPRADRRMPRRGRGPVPAILAEWRSVTAPSAPRAQHAPAWLLPPSSHTCQD
jgi:hypothetical protein